MPNPLESILAERPVIILDGALATELERRGADLRDPLWSAKCLLESPDLIRDVHTDYLRAGADVITTATYQATFQGFQAKGLEEADVADLLHGAVELAVTARNEFWGVASNRLQRSRPLVAASIGPYGAMLADGSEYRGGYGRSEDELRRFHRPRLQLLAASGADLLAFETIPCLNEALVLAGLLEECSTVSAWLSFSCQDGHRTSEGDSVARCAEALQPFERLSAIGINCTRPEFAANLLRDLAGATDKPLIAYPNSGESYDPADKSWCGAKSFGDQARQWYQAGARIIGGCCRTSPSDIRRIKLELEVRST